MNVSKNSSWRTSFSSKAFKIVSIYLAISLFWIFSTDKLVFTLISDTETQNLVSSIKGWFFVIVTTFLLYYLIQRAIKEVSTVEQKLIESEIKFRSVFENSVDAISVSKERKHLFINNAHIALFGYSQNEIIDKPVLDLIAPRQREYVNDIVVRRAKGEAVPSSYETIGLKKDGSEFDIDVKVSSYYLNNDQYTLAIFRDITSRKKAEDAIHESEQRYQTLANISPVGIFRTDANGKTTYVNPKWCKISGLSSHEAMGDDWLNTVHEEDKRGLSDNWNEAAHQHKISLAEYRFVHSDGTIKWVMGQAVPEKNFEGQITGYVGTITDITQRKRTEEALKQSEEKFAKAFQNSPDAISITRASDGLIIEVNESFIRLSGYKRREIIGHSVIELNFFINPQDRESYVSILQEKERVTNFEIAFRTKEGEILIFLLSAEIYVLHGEQYILGILHDITQRKKIEEEILKLNRIYAVISQINQAIVKTHNKEKLFAEACRIAVEFGKFQMSWIGLVDEKTETVNPITYYGIEDGYLSKISVIPIINIDKGCDPTGTAVREGKYSVCNDIENDSRMVPWKEEALKREYRSSIALPLKLYGKSIGAFTLYSSLPNFFDKEEIDLFYEISNDISFALEAIENEKKRRQTEEALYESESYNRMLFNQSVIGLAVASMDGKLVDISPTFAKIIGRTVEETKQLSYWDITPQKYMVQEQQQLDSLSTTGRYGPYEKEYIHKDGHLIPVRLQGLIIERNNEKFIWSSVEDITNRKQIEESLRDSEERFRTAFRTSPDAIYLTRLEDGKYVEVNEGFTNLTGYTYKDVIGTSSLILNIWHNPEDRKRLVEGLKKDGRVNNLEALFVRKDGTCLTGLMSATILNIKGVPHILTITRDIDYIKKTQEALINQEKHYRALFDLSPSGIVVADTDGIVIEVNDAYCKTTGYTHEELIGKNLKLVVSDEDSEKVNKNKTEILSGKVLTHEVINKHKDGSHRNLELRETVVQLMNGQSGILSVSNDITERKHAFEELQKSRQEYRALSAHLQKIREDERAAIAREMHDELGQILTSLKMNIAFTRRELEASNSIEIKNKILTEFQLMNLTIDKAVSQVRKLITQLRPELLDKLGLIAALEWYSEEYQKTTKINCVFTSESEELFLNHDLELAIFRIVQEAMTNAAKHSEAKTLHIRLSKKEDKLIIEICDDGKGILGSDLDGSTSFGLMGMRERANLIGGILEIFGAQGKGTTVRLSVKV